MRHIAIDLGSRKSQISIREPDGTLVRQAQVRTDNISAHLPRDQSAQVVLETCSEAFAVADQVISLGLEPKVVPATLAPLLGVGQRGVKTDKRDANILSQASCGFAAAGLPMPSVHIVSHQSRERKSQVAMRQTLVECRTAMINSVHGWLRTGLNWVPTGETETFPQRVRAVLLKSPEGMPLFVETQLQAIEGLTERIDQASKAIAKIAMSDPICQLLMTAPGVGPIVSFAFAAVMDDISRFRKASSVGSYLGLTPGEDSSSKREKRTGITKAGPALFRQLLIQACWCMWRTRVGDPMVRWASQIAERRGKQVALTAMARKLAGILYAMWRDGVRFNPSRSVAPIAA